MPITGFYCPYRGDSKLHQVDFATCLQTCATRMAYPPCGLPYNVLEATAKSIRAPLPPGEISVTQVLGCLTKQWLVRTTPEVFGKVHGFHYRVRGGLAHEYLARFALPGSLVEQRFRVSIPHPEGEDNGWYLSGGTDNLVPLGIRSAGLRRAGIAVAPHKRPALTPCWTPQTCTLCGANIAPQQGWEVFLRGTEEQTLGHICPHCLESLRQDGDVYYRLFDWKTTRRVPVKDMRDRDRDQMVAYITLAERARYPISDVRVVYIDMSMARSTAFPISFARVPDIWDEWIVPQAQRLLQALEDEAMPEPGPLWEPKWECGYCDVDYLCPYYTPRKRTSKRAKK